LKGKYLFGYVSERESQLERGIYLFNFTATPDATRKERFEINVPGVSVYYLEADTETERQTWLNKLNLTTQNITTKICIYNLTGKDQSTGSDWIYKSGGKNSSFKRRWCVLRGNLFYYYENQQDTNPKGYWDLFDCELGRIKEKDGATRYRWKITLKEDKATKDERVLYVESADKRERWLNLFLAAKGANLNLELKSAPKSLQQSTTTPTTTAKKDGPEATPATGAPKRPEKGPDLDKIPPNRDMSVKNKQNEAAPPPAETQFSFAYDGELSPEILELVSPRPFTMCYLSHKVYDDKNIEKERNSEALKSGRGVGLDEEWDEGESDWISGGEEIEEDDGCLIM